MQDEENFKEVKIPAFKKKKPEARPQQAYFVNDIDNTCGCK